MTQIKLFVAILALTFVAFFPAAALADEGMEGLDVTMMVLDDESDLGDEISAMPPNKGRPDTAGCRRRSTARRSSQMLILPVLNPQKSPAISARRGSKTF